MILDRLIKKIGAKSRKEEVPQPEEIEKLSRLLEQTNMRLTRLEADLEKATAGYRLMLVQQNPEILPELIRGESLEELDHSLAGARELTEKMKQKLEQKLAAEQVPAGAPARIPPDIEKMSPGEKIRAGLQK